MFSRTGEINNNIRSLNVIEIMFCKVVFDQVIYIFQVKYSIPHIFSGISWNYKGWGLTQPKVTKILFVFPAILLQMLQEENVLHSNDQFSVKLTAAMFQLTAF